MSERDERWEGISAPRRMWGVFDVEQPYEATPLAMFSDKAQADRWVELMRQSDDEDERLTQYHQVFPVEDIEGSFWNSYDDAPELS